MVTRPEDFVTAPLVGYSSSMIKREYIATHLAQGLASNPKIDAGKVPAYAVILADRLIAYLNESPPDADRPLPEASIDPQPYRKER